MTFDDLVAGDTVLVDANTFIYHFAPDPVLGPPYSRLLQRIENQEIQGVTSVHLLAEVAHKMMTIEANQRLGWPFAGMANRLRRHPTEVQQLKLSPLCVTRVAQSRVRVLPVSLSVLLDATGVGQQSGLLVNDALIVALMRQQGLSCLASHDADFDRVPGLTRYAPV